MPVIFLTIFLLIGAALPAPLLAQDLEPPHHANFAQQFLKDQVHTWTSPLKIHRGDVKWLVPLGAGAALLFANDHAISNKFRENESLRPASRMISNFGSSVPTLAASGGMLAIGKLTHNQKVATTGMLATEAVLHSEVVIHGLKLLFNRERPNKLDGQGSFWGGGQSFPSGHAASSWAFATIVAHQYKNKPIVTIGAYSFATVVSLSRVGGLNHFPSDVLIGATIGHLIGRYVLHHHPFR